MKKLLFSLVALVAMSLTFVACDQKEPEPEPVKSNCKVYNAQYLIDQDGAIYIFEILTNGLSVDANNNVSGTGDDCMIMVYAMPQADGFPKAKVYNVVPVEELTENDTECVVGGTVMNNQPIGTFAYVIEDGEGVEGLLCQGGTMKFEGNATNGTITANFEFVNAKGEVIEREYIYSGAFEMEEVQASAPKKVQRIK
jgi:hypothetical protein